MGKDLPTSTVVSPRMASESIYMVCPPAHCLTSNIVTPQLCAFQHRGGGRPQPSRDVPLLPSISTPCPAGAAQMLVKSHVRRLSSVKDSNFSPAVRSWAFVHCSTWQGSLFPSTHKELEATKRVGLLGASVRQVKLCLSFTLMHTAAEDGHGQASRATLSALPTSST